MLTFLYACDNTLNVIAPYKETPVVYALLNKADSVQYIKINKTFLGQGDAFVFAQQADSLYLPYAIDVKLLGSKNDQIVQTITCSSVNVPKETGVFNAAEMVYVTPKIKLDSTLSYTLEVRNKASQKLICSGVTAIIGDFKLLYPSAIINLYQNAKYAINTISWLAPENAFRYDLDLLISYKEMNKTTQVVVDKSAVLRLVRGATLSGVKNKEQSFTFSGKDIYVKIGLALKVDTNLVRQLNRNVIYSYSLAAADLDKYLSLSEPVLTLSDVKPEYGNIKNGLGLFSSRYNKYVKVYLDEVSYNQLLVDPFTAKLNFQ